MHTFAVADILDCQKNGYSIAATEMHPPLNLVGHRGLAVLRGLESQFASIVQSTFAKAARHSSFPDSCVHDGALVVDGEFDDECGRLVCSRQNAFAGRGRLSASKHAARVSAKC